VTKKKLDLLQFASRTMAQARASAAKIVRCQIVYAGLLGTPLDRIPDYVGRHASLLSLSTFQNPPEYFSLDRA
jgi:hypothetical protein